jgi:hypothetical protein
LPLPQEVQAGREVLRALEASLVARERQLEEGWQALQAEVALMTRDASAGVPSSPMTPTSLVRGALIQSQCARG